MSNEFSKEERVAFEEILAAFNDELAISRLVKTYRSDQTMMARTGDTFWRPKPYIMPSFDGLDQSANFTQRTQLSVPASIDTIKSSPWLMSPTELRDALQEKRLGDGARQKLASDINRAVLDVVSDQSTLFVKRSGAAAGFEDVAAVDAIMNETGVPMDNRHLALSTRDYNGMANDLSKASRSLDNEISVKALRKAYVGDMAGISTWKLDYAKRKAAALAVGGSAITMSTLDAAGNYYVPQATSVASTGQRGNVDNRYDTITVSSGTNVRAGDAFTIANVEAVHPITKESTGQLKTFRVISVSGNDLVISPPIISNQGGSLAEQQYQNCTVTAKSGTAGITFLNTVAGYLNPFWVEGCVELLPGRLVVPSDGGIGVMRGSTDQGVELIMSKQSGIDGLNTKFRFDVFFGVTLLDPEMAGVMMFSQT
jgi:hypothetical protein